jgi:hypothetical protein
MANVFYVKGAEKILSGAIDFSTDTIKAILLKNTYAQNLATDEFLSGISAHRLGSDQTLTSKSITGGKFDADDATWTGVAGGEVSEGVAIYKDTGDPATSPLLAYIDTINGFPLTSVGGDIAPQWDNGTNKIFSFV